MSVVGTDLRTVSVCLLVIALCAGPVAATQAGTPTGTTAGTDDSGGPAVLVLLAFLPVALLVGVVTAVVAIADRRATNVSGG